MTDFWQGFIVGFAAALSIVLMVGVGLGAWAYSKTNGGKQ